MQGKVINQKVTFKTIYMASNTKNFVLKLPERQQFFEPIITAY